MKIKIKLNKAYIYLYIFIYVYLIYQNILNLVRAYVYTDFFSIK
jgi:hypothetical protein